MLDRRPIVVIASNNDKQLLDMPCAIIELHLSGIKHRLVAEGSSCSSKSRSMKSA
jgi:hypothetical protein